MVLAPDHPSVIRPHAELAFADKEFAVAADAYHELVS